MNSDVVWFDRIIQITRRRGTSTINTVATSVRPRHVGQVQHVDRPRTLRKSPQTCDWNRLTQRECSVPDFCIGITSDPNAHRHCHGDMDGFWQFIAADNGELCFYQSEESEQPFVQSLFHPDTDFCYRWQSTMDVNGTDPLRYEERIEFTRPIQATYSVAYELHPCNATPALQWLSGYCSVDSSVEINGDMCKPCQSLNSSAVTQKRDCSNLHPSLSGFCDMDDDHLFWVVGQYIGADCSLGAAAFGNCSVDRLCQRLNIDALAKPTCMGDPQGYWRAAVQYPEQCYRDSTPLISPQPLPYNDAKLEPDHDHYCTSSSLSLAFRGSELLTEERNLHVTGTIQSQIQEISRVTPCTQAEDPAFIFDYAKAYCRTGCPIVSIGGIECTSDCFTCPSGYNAWDCSNIEKSMVESCSQSENPFDDKNITVLDASKEEERNMANNVLSLVGNKTLGVEAARSGWLWANLKRKESFHQRSNGMHSGSAMAVIMASSIIVSYLSTQ